MLKQKQHDIAFGLMRKHTCLRRFLGHLALLFFDKRWRIDVALHIIFGLKFWDLAIAKLLFTHRFAASFDKWAVIIDQIVDRQAGIDEVFDGFNSVMVGVAADPRAVVGHFVDHPTICFGKIIIVFEKIDVRIDVRDDGFLVDKIVAFQQIGIRGIGIDHHLVNFRQAIFVAFRKLLVFHTKTPVRIAGRKSAERSDFIHLLIVDRFKNSLEKIESKFNGDITNLFDNFLEMWRYRFHHWTGYLLKKTTSKRPKLQAFTEKLFDGVVNRITIFNLGYDHAFVFAEILIDVFDKLSGTVGRFDLPVTKHVCAR